MAFSSSEGKLLFKDFLLHIAKPMSLCKFLDVGCGAGTYGRIIREVYGNNGEVIGGVEIFPEYIERHNLREVYTEIIVGDIRQIHPLLPVMDLIICGDVLEHMEKQEAIDLVNALKVRCRFIFCALPVKIGRPWSTGYRQSDHEYMENPANKHRHDWTGEEIATEFKPLWMIPFVQTGCFLVEGGIR